MGRVEVRMGDDDRIQSAFTLDEVHGRCVDEGNEIPEHVSGGCLKEDGTLTDAELLSSGCGIGEA